MKMISEFKAFALKGNVIDMAVGIIIGLAFGKIVTSLVNDLIMPPIGLLLGGVNFTDLKIVLKEAAGDIPAVTLNYGNFIQVVIDFMLVAIAVFLLIKALSFARKKQESVPVIHVPTKEEALLTEIRDILKNK